jgi:uncharacterized protein (TIGR03000 family)
MRTFTSPALTAGIYYTYHIRARWTEGGRMIDQTRAMPVRAGEQALVDFTAAAPEPAPRPAGE